jgi:glycosyltransferase involved in cell wall biosynthesis
MADANSIASPAEAPASASRGGAAVRVLVIFNTLCLYGLERSIIEIFASLRPHFEACLLIPEGTSRHNTRLLAEIRHWSLAHAFFSDHADWPRIGRPRSLRAAWRILHCLVTANRDVLRLTRQFDVLYVPNSTGLYLSAAAALWFRLTGRRVIYSFHDLELKPSRYLWLGARWVSDFIHLSDHSYRAVLAANPWIGWKKNHVIAPTVVVRGRAGDGGPAAGPAAGGRSILYLGQVTGHKGIDLLLEAFRMLAAEFPDVRLQIVGGAEWEYDGDFQGILQNSPFADRIRYWGYVGNVEAFLRSSYIYVQPSKPSVVHESFGRGAVEAMWAGLPVVCFRSGSLQEIVEHEVTGLVCETESVECLAGALRRILRHPEERERFSANALTRFDAKYSVARINRQWRELLK